MPRKTGDRKRLASRRVASTRRTPGGQHLLHQSQGQRLLRPSSGTASRTDGSRIAEKPEIRYAD